MVYKPCAHKIRYCITANKVCFSKIQTLGDLFLNFDIFNISLDEMNPNNRHHL